MHVKIIENTRFSEAFMPKIHKNCDDGMSARNDRSVSSSRVDRKTYLPPAYLERRAAPLFTKAHRRSCQSFVKNVTDRFSYISPALFSERAGFLIYENRIR